MIVSGPPPPLVAARPSPAQVVLPLLAGLYCGLLAALLWADAAGPERWWWSSLNLYVPQWIWGVPCAVLLAWTLRRARRWAWIPAAELLLVAGPLMGFNWPRRQPAPEGRGLRVMSYNVKWGRRDLGAIAAEISADHPDLVLMQDADGSLEGPLGALLHEWHVVENGQYILASRYPLTHVREQLLSLPTVGERPFTYVRCEMRIGAARVGVFDVHLITPRRGLVAVKRAGNEGISALEGNMADRMYQAALLAQDLSRERGPVIVVGDFNVPVQSLICRRLMAGGLTDAFCAAGHGYGYTYGGYMPLGLPYVRIDHILFSAPWRAERCWAGNARGSDHRPVIADLRLPPDDALPGLPPRR